MSCPCGIFALTWCKHRPLRHHERIRIKSLQQHKGGILRRGCIKVLFALVLLQETTVEYLEDRKPAEKFMEESRGLWEKASEKFQGVLPGNGRWRRLTEYTYPKGLQRMAGVWSGCVLNIGSQSPVQTCSWDVGESPFEYNCLTAFGDFQGAIELWKAEVSIELRLLICYCFWMPVFTTRTLSCHSCVAFTSKNMYDWFVVARIWSFR